MAWTRMTRWSLVGFAIAGLSGLAACTTDDSDPGVDGDTSSTSSTGSGGSTTGSSADTTTGSDSTTGETSTTGSGGNTSAGTGVCASPIAISTSTPGIANFDEYDGAAILSEWSFPLAQDPSLNVFLGPFGYGDDHVDDASGNEVPEAFELVDGNDSTYALSISDTEAEEYGGGMGLWTSACINASAFSGISFWVRGDAPTGMAKFTLLLGDTTPEADGDTEGTCSGTIDTCVHPTYDFPVTDEWTEIEIPWNQFTPGQTPEAVVEPNGNNIWQLQFDIGLEWVEGDSGEYEPVPAGYELVVDDMTFY